MCVRVATLKPSGHARWAMCLACLGQGLQTTHACGICQIPMIRMYVCGWRCLTPSRSMGSFSTGFYHCWADRSCRAKIATLGPS
ncbi:uncharacterized protein F5Z01DRAFT_644598 [Emericellopsis atlantica]|uniref:Secreted protein n=1 Tax=Emericellopsis atlantica TaxID=2614577 RepID=A0A9P7ZU92_9HYPO|nr:uncharacterized protein F5Z01DRAFT_644598 [Emericellopsis atlantica]KAG9257932.1 hypothetical protein F5Z01DRAFT_644598 [Emericellopsis atlantica]